jgi:hypothetical protein
LLRNFGTILHQHASWQFLVTRRVGSVTSFLRDSPSVPVTVRDNELSLIKTAEERSTDRLQYIKVYFWGNQDNSSTYVGGVTYAMDPMHCSGSAQTRGESFLGSGR